MGYSNPAADDLIIKIRQEYDHERLVGYCRRLHTLIAEDQPYTFLYVPRWTAVLDKRIVIRESAPDGSPRYRRITATKTGNHMFDFNRWVKLAEAPHFSAE